VINIVFVISNPLDHWHGVVASKSWSLSKNKAIELNLYRDNSIAGFSFQITSGQRDHKGFEIHIHLIGYSLEFHFYDCRHFQAEN